MALAAIPLLWAFHHAVKSLTSTLGRRALRPLGTPAHDRGRLGRLRRGLSRLRAGATGPWHAWMLFALYGLFPALTEGPERALVADLSTGARGRAFGLYHALTGAMLLPASLLTGALWQAWGAAAALGLGAALAGAAAVALLLLVPDHPEQELQPARL